MIKEKIRREIDQTGLSFGEDILTFVLDVVMINIQRGKLYFISTLLLYAFVIYCVYWYGEYFNAELGVFFISILVIMNIFIANKLIKLYSYKSLVTKYLVDYRITINNMYDDDIKKIKATYILTSFINDLSIRLYKPSILLYNDMYRHSKNSLSLSLR